eukprot:CAMPEP_0197475714 /NCGR_PEP_ID=MMETSP1309-20131121/7145_1 /TAXON_ID=464262 /ORGANISM="Genus nov. species nov., Strain RCC998" /LENGTH=253 /DNA_ID=CAMNT_0043015823 /DNA_START=94 /DNA_END=855 /DNA_ORIENTATION=+
MAYTNGVRYNNYKSKAKRVWKREEHGEGGGDSGAEKEKEKEVEERSGVSGSSGRELRAQAKPFVTRKRKNNLSAQAEPFDPAARKRKLEELERKKQELQDKIREKKRKIAEDEVFKKKQKALRDAAKHSQDVAERKAKIARLQGGFDKIKKSMKGSNADGGESQVETLNSQQTNLKPTNKMKDVTRDDVLRVLHALNDYDVLQVNLASGSSEIRKNFLKLSRAFHPDKCRIDGSKEAFQRVSKAYTNLKKQVS